MALAWRAWRNDRRNSMKLAWRIDRTVLTFIQETRKFIHIIEGALISIDVSIPIQCVRIGYSRRDLQPSLRSSTMRWQSRSHISIIGRATVHGVGSVLASHAVRPRQ
jgi:hypothetical protein